MKYKIDKYSLIEEMRAIDRRKDALSKGIVPANGTNWNAVRKNKKLQSKAKNFSNDLAVVNADLNKGNFFSKNKEYGGTVKPDGHIEKINSLGNRRSVENITNSEYGKSSFHKHPIIDIKPDKKFQNKREYKNIPSRPSGHMGQLGDLSTYAEYRNQNNKSRLDFIGAPDSRLHNVSTIRSTDKKQDVTHFANNAKDHYNLNGDLKNSKSLDPNTILNKADVVKNRLKKYKIIGKDVGMATKEALNATVPAYKEAIKTRSMKPIENASEKFKDSSRKIDKNTRSNDLFLNHKKIKEGWKDANTKKDPRYLHPSREDWNKHDWRNNLIQTKVL